MQIDFFEEYPTPVNLAKAKQLDFSSAIYIAARSFEEFEAFRKKLKAINRYASAGYWPILKTSYWISPFSSTDELDRLYKDLSAKGKDKQTRPLKILLDLELPLDRGLIARNIFSYFRNKGIIKRIFEEAERLDIGISTAEYHATSWIDQKVLELLGVSYPIDRWPHKKITMFYSSMMDERLKDKVKSHISGMTERFGNNFQVGLGTIATGVFGNEPLLSPESLDKDLDFLDKQGVETAVIFRLGGLNKQYLKVIEKYV